LDLGGVLVDEREQVFGAGEVGFEGGLLLGEQLARQGVLEEGIEELALALFDLGDARALVAGGVLTRAPHSGYRELDGVADVVDVANTTRAWSRSAKTDT